MSYDFLEELDEAGGYWQHKPGQKYLAKLTSGKVSDTFLNTGMITTDPEELECASLRLLERLGVILNGDNTISTSNNMELPTHVIGPAAGGVTLAYEVAKILGAKALFTEPEYSYEINEAKEDAMTCSYEAFDGKEMQISLVKRGQKFRFDLPDDAKVLFVEDVITTGKSTNQMIDAVHKSKDNNVFNSYGKVLCLINRSEHTKVPTRYLDIVSLADVKPFELWHTANGLSRENLTFSKIWDTLEDAQKDLPEVEAVLRPKQEWEKLTNGKDS